MNFNNESVNSKGVLTTSNFSNSEYNQTNTKPTNVFKWFDGKNSSKSKRTNEGYLKATAASEATNYSSNRPKSAKGAGMYINTSKYRNSEGYTSNKYKNSINKGSVGSKNALKKSGNTSQLKKNQSVKIITAKTSKELGSSYNKTNNASVTKYVKTARGSKKLESSCCSIIIPPHTPRVVGGIISKKLEVYFSKIIPPIPPVQKLTIYNKNYVNLFYFIWIFF